MRLPMYITGLTKDTAYLKKMDGSLLKKLGFDIARKLGGNVVAYHEPRYPCNYFRLDIQFGDSQKSILLHEYFPYAAIAHYKNELQIHFLDDDKMAKELETYYTVLEAAFLNKPFEPSCHDLSAAELENEKYWRPNTNGEVIFNCWD